MIALAYHYLTDNVKSNSGSSWWTGGSDYCLTPVFLHTFQRENTVMYTVLSSLAACGRLGVAAAGVLFWHAAS